MAGAYGLLVEPPRALRPSPIPQSLRPALRLFVAMPSEPLIAYIHGDTPPDFAAIAAFGFDVVCLDNSAPWYSEDTVNDARRHGLTPFAFRMGYVG